MGRKGILFLTESHALPGGPAFVNKAGRARFAVGIGAAVNRSGGGMERDRQDTFWF